MLRQMTESEREKFFGPLPKVLGLKDGTYDYGDAGVEWEFENLVMVKLPVSILTYRGITRKVSCNRAIAGSLEMAFNAIFAAILWDDIVFYGGCYMPRPMRNSNIPSDHAWGIAIDLNPEQNALGTLGAAPSKYGSLHRIAPIMLAHGFIQRPNDPMHFGPGVET